MKKKDNTNSMNIKLKTRECNMHAQWIFMRFLH